MVVFTAYFYADNCNLEGRWEGCMVHIVGEKNKKDLTRFDDA